LQTAETLHYLAVPNGIHWVVPPPLPMSAQSANSLLIQTTAALESGISAIPLSNGRATIENWLDILSEEAKTPQIDAVIADLTLLHQMLNGTEAIEVTALNSLLQSLAGKTEVIGSAITGDIPPGTPIGTEQPWQERKRRSLLLCQQLRSQYS
jgi:hypothetical protein